MGVFNINCPFFCMVVNMICSHAYSIIGCFAENPNGTKKKVLGNKVSK